MLAIIVSIARERAASSDAQVGGAANLVRQLHCFIIRTMIGDVRCVLLVNEFSWH